MLENFKENPLIEKNIEIANNYTSCIYCGIKNEDVLVQCGECDHKFCNGISEDINNSHILLHFEKSKHNCIKYPKRKLNEELYFDNYNMEIIACGYCDEKNIYKLFYYKNIEKKKIEFLCEVHLNKKISESKSDLDVNYYKNNFQKIVHTELNQKVKKKFFCISPTLISVPKNLEDINFLSDCDKEIINANEQIIQQMDVITHKFLNKVKLKYETSNEYYNIYKPLIYSEWTYTKKIFEMKKQYNIELNYSKINKIFYFEIEDDFMGINFSVEKRISFSQEIDLISDLFNMMDEEEKPGRFMPINFIGVVINIIHKKKYFCKRIEILPIREDMINNIINNLGKYYIKEDFCDVPYMRMIIGLEHFINVQSLHNSNNYTSNLIFSQILGIINMEQIKDLEENELKDIFNENELIKSIDNYGELNTTQKKCLSKVFSHTLNMIQGPPGTGKTFLASFIIYNIYNKRKNDTDKILVCAPSNSAADNLAQYLINLINNLNLNSDGKKIKILRVYPKAKELFENNTLKEISLHNKLKIAVERYKKIKIEEKMKSCKSFNYNYDNTQQNNLSKNFKNNTMINNIESVNEQYNSNFNSNFDNNFYINFDNNFNSNFNSNFYSNYSNEFNNDYFEEEKLEENDEENYIITPELIKKFAKYIINEHDIIISTCSTSYDEKLINANFKYVLIDEATQCCELESLLPIMHGSRYVIMIGDQKQLGPTIIYPKGDLVGMKISLFERMIKLYPDNYYMLKEQYRMSEELALFPSKFFYQGKIKNSSKHKSKENKYIKKILKKFYWANKDIPMMFINTNNSSTYKYNKSKKNLEINTDSNNFTSESDIGKSFQNELEADITLKILNIFNSIKSFKKGKYDIGIITPYSGQKKLILEKLIYSDENKSLSYIDYIKNNIISIASVDSFQGKEKDFIIINTVRSNYKNMIGFLKDIRRLNVSITRARHGLIIIGDAFCLAKSIGENDNKFSIWKYLIKYYQDLGIIVDYIDGAENEKMFEPTKIIEDKDELKDYIFNEYDFDGTGNKPFIKEDYYMDDYFFIKDSYIKHYIEDEEFFPDIDDEFLNNEKEFFQEFFKKLEENENNNNNDKNNDIKDDI